METLGIRLSSRELVGFGLAVLAGMVVARILPSIYPILAPLLDALFGKGASPARDGFNAFMMTALTFLSSFVISFSFFRKPKKA